MQSERCDETSRADKGAEGSIERKEKCIDDRLKIATVSTRKSGGRQQRRQPTARQDESAGPDQPTMMKSSAGGQCQCAARERAAGQREEWKRADQPQLSCSLKRDQIVGIALI
jgi:hypothetical protein